MKKNVVIFGSTGSVGTNTFEVIKNDKKNFNVILLSTNSNVKKIISQAKQLNVKNIIINNQQEYLKAKKNIKN